MANIAFSSCFININGAMRKILVVFSIIILTLVLASCSTMHGIRVNWADNIHNPINYTYRDSSQMSYVVNNYDKCGDSTITWFYYKIDRQWRYKK